MAKIPGRQGNKTQSINPLCLQSGLYLSFAQELIWPLVTQVTRTINQWNDIKQRPQNHLRKTGILQLVHSQHKAD